jgi:1A family penicillin-binding protein
MNDMGARRDFLRTSWTIFKMVAQVAMVMLVLGGTVVALLVVQEINRLPSMDYLKTYKPVDSISIYDRNDNLIERINLGMQRTVIPFKDVPRTMQQAVLAAEDKNFYKHGGMSFQGILRAAVANAKALKMVEGGSTITQQLAKNLFFSDVQRNGVVKLAEVVASYRLEEKYSKQELFSLYLTEIYFGNGARGIEQAAHNYFGKRARNLTLGESAFLAGIIRAPSFLGAKEHRKEAMVRQKQVLRAMVECGFISDSDCLTAEAEPLTFKRVEVARPSQPFKKYPYFTALVLEAVRKQFDTRTIGLNGLEIYTTLDPIAQEAAEEVLASEIRRAPPGIEEEALVSLSVKDGSIRALVGGAHDYWKNQWNSAVNPHTAGSSLKPFIYLTAFMAGVLTPESTVQDKPFKLTQETGEEWAPKNYDGKYMGDITVREALLNSRNMCTIRVLEQVGIPNAIGTLRAAGIKTELAPTMALALGSSAVTPLELASAYGTLARGGVAINPWMIRQVKDSRGQLLDAYVPLIHRVFPLEQTSWLVDILTDVVRRGTGTQARLAGRPVAGKTGTADKAKDIWFVGFTPDMVTAVWGGGDEKSPVAGKHVTGGTVMARVFRNYNQRFYAASPTSAGELVTSRYASSKEPATKPISHSNDVPYTDIDPNAQYAQQAAPEAAKPVAQPAARVQTQKGVTEYHWNQ